MNNKVVWITGASSGIGEALVYAYSAQGAKLIISSRNRDELFRVKSGCKNKINVHVLSLDLEQADTLAGKAEEAVRIFGKVDLLINCAGVGQPSLALETTYATAQRIMNINFWGSVVLSKEIIPVMLANGDGHVVCLSSLAGKFGAGYNAAYAASKHALHGYFDALRAELAGKPVNITLVCPGQIKTNLSVNTLNANGSPQGTTADTPENGMSPEACAAQIVSAIKQNKEEVFIGGKEVKGIWFKRLFPSRFSR